MTVAELKQLAAKVSSWNHEICNSQDVIAYESDVDALLESATPRVVAALCDVVEAARHSPGDEAGDLDLALAALDEALQ